MEIIQNLLLSAAAFIVVLSVVVFVHEFGHFQAARWCGIAIDTFSIGFGKAIASWRDKQGVQWKIGSLPLGGYVKFADDSDGISMGPKETLEDRALKAEARRKGMFHAQPLLPRAFVVAAGPLANFIFAIFAFAVLAMVVGNDVTDYRSVTPRIGAVIEDSAAAEAGVRSGEIIVAVDNRPIQTWGEFQDIVGQSADRTLAVTLSEGGNVRTVSVTPRVTERLRLDGVTERAPVIGVGLDPLPQQRVIESVGPIQAVGQGAAQTWAVVTQTWNYVSGMVTGKNSGRDIAGPLGIFSASGQVAKSALDTPPDRAIGGPGGTLVLSLLGLAALLSVAVGIVNLLPIPILDGGHLMFYAIEAVRGGKPLPAVAQEWAFRAGLAVMASLFLFATWNDVTRHFGSQG